MQKPVVLTLDVGNTRVSGVCFGSKGGVLWRDSFWTHDPDPRVLRRMSRRIDAAAEVAILSVVPAATRRLAAFWTEWTGQKPKIMGKDCPFAIRNRARKPAQVGADRLANASAAFARFKENTVVVDFGTAVTFDVVSDRGEYLGGAIAPGMRLALKALGQQTALLPQLRFQSAHRVIGRDTKECLLSGCVLGLASLCDGMIGRIRSEWKREFKVIATGGDAALMRRYSRAIQFVDPDLTHKGGRISLLNFLNGADAGKR